jgi:hypothetical protein
LPHNLWTLTHLVLNTLDVGEPSGLDALLLQITLLHEERASKSSATFSEELRPELQAVKIISGSVITTDVDVCFGGLDPAVGGTAAVSFLEEGRPVFDGAEEIADMDEVKGVFVPCPVEGGVVDLELDVGGNPAGDGE